MFFSFQSGIQWGFRLIKAPDLPCDKHCVSRHATCLPRDFVHAELLRRQCRVRHSLLPRPLVSVFAPLFFPPHLAIVLAP